MDATHLEQAVRFEVVPVVRGMAEAAASGHDGAMWSTQDESREVLRMRIALPSQIPAPVWPDGSHVRRFHPSDARRLHALLEHGSSRGGGSVEAFEVWLEGLTGDSEFDPDLCFLVEVGDVLAAAAICWTSAFVKDVVVHEAWRCHGFGEALLRLAFRTFQERGAAHVELKVAASNASAIRLYERVGMRTVERLSEP